MKVSVSRWKAGCHVAEAFFIVFERFTSGGQARPRSRLFRVGVANGGAVARAVGSTVGGATSPPRLPRDFCSRPGNAHARTTAHVCTRESDASYAVCVPTVTTRARTRVTDSRLCRVFFGRSPRLNDFLCRDIEPARVVRIRASPGIILLSPPFRRRSSIGPSASRRSLASDVDVFQWKTFPR